MVVKRKKKRASKPLELPGRWLKSKSGRTYSYIIVCGDRDWRNVQLYKLQSLMFDFERGGEIRHLTVSEKLWTEPELREAGRFLKNAPTKAMIEAAKRIAL